MAANSNFLFVGTNQGTTALEINKTTFATTTFGGFEPAIPVSSITSDLYGYVTINYGSGSDTAFFVIGPNGAEQEDGGGNQTMLGTMQGFIPPSS